MSFFHDIYSFLAAEHAFYEAGDAVLWRNSANGLLFEAVI